MKRKIKIEFHIHTIASKDSIQSKFLMLLMCKIKKIDVLAITDHNEISYAQKNKKFFEKHNIKIIVGEEIFTRDGEIIGLFLTQKITPNLSVEDTVKLIKQQKGLVYIPHPYDEKRAKTVLKIEALEKIKNEIDFIEINNGRNIDEKFSIKQNEIAEKYKLRKIVGSDAHTFYELGRNYCLIKEFQKDTLIKNIEQGEFYCKKCIKFAHKNTKIVKIVKILIKGDFNEFNRIIKRKFKRRR